MLLQLKLMLDQPIFNEKPLKTSRVKKLQLTFATLSDSSLVPDLKDIFKNEGGAGSGDGTPMDETPAQETGGGLFSGLIPKNKASAGDRPTIPDCVLVFIVKGKLYIVKENWSEWDSEFSTCPPEAKKEMKASIIGALQELQKETVHPEALNSMPEVRRMAELRRLNKVSLFSVLVCLEIRQITRLFVHKGSVPSVEIKCFSKQDADKKEEDSDDEGQHHIDLQFTGDMERQLFVSRIWDYRSGGGQGASDEEDEDDYQENMRARGLPDEENEDTMSEGDKASESDEEHVEATIYD